jgi:hypothetical protein
MLVTNTRIRTSLTNFAQFVGSKNEKELIELFQDLLTDIAGGIVMTELALGDGTVSDLAIKFGTDGNNGFYGVSDTILGIAIEGALVAEVISTGLATDAIAELTGAAGVTVDGVLLKDSAISLANGTVGALALQLGADKDNGIYGISDTQLGVAVEGTLVAGANTLGLFTSNVAEQIVGVGVTVDGATARDGYIINKPTPTAVNTSAAITAAQLLAGVITSTSAAPVTVTLPTVASIVAVLGNARGSSFDFVIDNTLGASTVTVALDASITQLVNVPNGGAGLLTVAASATLGVGIFRMYFYSATAAVISRIA